MQRLLYHIKASLRGTGGWYMRPFTICCWANSLKCVVIAVTQFLCGYIIIWFQKIWRHLNIYVAMPNLPTYVHVNYISPFVLWCVGLIIYTFIHTHLLKNCTCMVLRPTLGILIHIVWVLVDIVYGLCLCKLPCCLPLETGIFCYNSFYAPYNL